MIELEGLTADEALKRLRKYGQNTIPEEKFNPLAIFLKKFWAPIWLPIAPHKPFERQFFDV